MADAWKKPRVTTQKAQALLYYNTSNNAAHCELANESYVEASTTQRKPQLWLSAMVKILTA